MPGPLVEIQLRAKFQQCEKRHCIFLLYLAFNVCKIYTIIMLRNCRTFLYYKMSSYKRQKLIDSQRIFKTNSSAEKTNICHEFIGAKLVLRNVTHISSFWHSSRPITCKIRPTFWQTINYKPCMHALTSPFLTIDNFTSFSIWFSLYIA